MLSFMQVKEALRDATIAAQVAAHPLMLKATEARQAAIQQRQESRQINNTKKRIVSAKQATSMWQDAVDLEAQAIKDILDKYSTFPPVDFVQLGTLFLSFLSFSMMFEAPNNYQCLLQSGCGDGNMCGFC